MSVGDRRARCGGRSHGRDQGRGEEAGGDGEGHRGGRADRGRQHLRRRLGVGELVGAGERAGPEQDRPEAQPAVGRHGHGGDRDHHQPDGDRTSRRGVGQQRRADGVPDPDDHEPGGETAQARGRSFRPAPAPPRHPAAAPSMTTDSSSRSRAAPTGTTMIAASVRTAPANSMFLRTTAPSSQAIVRRPPNRGPDVSVPTGHALPSRVLHENSVWRNELTGAGRADRKISRRGRVGAPRRAPARAFGTHRRRPDHLESSPCPPRPTRIPCAAAVCVPSRGQPRSRSPSA